MPSVPRAATVPSRFRVDFICVLLFRATGLGPPATSFWQAPVWGVASGNADGIVVPAAGAVTCPGEPLPLADGMANAGRARGTTIETPV
jgi:hypothetical protein